MATSEGRSSGRPSRRPADEPTWRFWVIQIHERPGWWTDLTIAPSFAAARERVLILARQLGDDEGLRVRATRIGDQARFTAKAARAGYNPPA